MKITPFLIFLLIILGCADGPRKTIQTQTPTNSPKAGPPATDADRLQQAKILLHSPPVSPEDIGTAEDYLKAIPRTALEYKEAQTLLGQTKQIRIDAAKREKQEQKTKRVEAINKLERDLLSAGMDFYFDWPAEDTLRIKYVLMSRPTVYKIQNETDFLQTLSGLGVKKVIFTDGYDHTWNISL